VEMAAGGGTEQAVVGQGLVGLDDSIFNQAMQSSLISRSRMTLTPTIMQAVICSRASYRACRHTSLD